jgi:hypothetical protein
VRDNPTGNVATRSAVTCGAGDRVGVAAAAVAVGAGAEADGGWSDDPPALQPTSGTTRQQQASSRAMGGLNG